MNTRHRRRLLTWTGLGCALWIGACSRQHSSDSDADGEGVKLGAVAQGLTVATGVYEIRAVHSSKCLEVEDFSTVDGGNLQQWTCDASNKASQRFIVTDVGSGEYTIVSQHSGKSLDVDSNPCALELFADASFLGASECFALGGTAMVPSAFNDLASSFKLAPGYKARLYADANYLGSVQLKSGPNLNTGLEDDTLVDDSFNDVVSSVNVYGNVRQWSPSGGAHQKFKILDQTGTGHYTIVPVSVQSRCFDVAGASLSDGADIQSWGCNGTNAQRFTFTAASGAATTLGTATLNDQFSYATAQDMTNSGLYEYRNDTTSNESACRFGDWALGVWNGELWLRTDNEEVPGDDDYLGERPCKSGEIRTSGSYGPYGNIEARMRPNASPGAGPSGKTGFMMSLFTASVSGTPPVTARALGIELTGLRLNFLETLLITNNNPQCTSFHECDGNHVAAVSPSSTFDPTGYDALGNAIWYTYKIEWRWHSIKYYVDGALVHTLRRPTRYSSAWADQAQRLVVSFTIPQHAIENSYGGAWVDTDIEPADAHEGQVDWLKFTPCSGPDCSLPL